MVGRSAGLSGGEIVQFNHIGFIGGEHQFTVQRKNLIVRNHHFKQMLGINDFARFVFHDQTKGGHVGPFVPAPVVHLFAFQRKLDAHLVFVIEQRGFELLLGDGVDGGFGKNGRGCVDCITQGLRRFWQGDCYLFRRRRRGGSRYRWLCRCV